MGSSQCIFDLTYVSKPQDLLSTKPPGGRYLCAALGEATPGLRPGPAVSHILTNFPSCLVPTLRGHEGLIGSDNSLTLWGSLEAG